MPRPFGCLGTLDTTGFVLLPFSLDRILRVLKRAAIVTPIFEAGQAGKIVHTERFDQSAVACFNIIYRECGTK
jgi:hypothetical protein